MANTYSSLFYHLVFSTKFRKRFIHPDIEDRVWSYIGGVARNYGATALRVGGIEDHIHALLMSPPKYSPSQLAKLVKADSSKWIRREFENKNFYGWQDGYSAFSISRSIVPRVIKYIENQREHHSSVTFEEEYLELLRLHDVDLVDEAYVFG